MGDLGLYKVKRRVLRFGVKKVEVSKGLASTVSGLRLRARGFGYMYCVRKRLKHKDFR